MGSDPGDVSANWFHRMRRGEAAASPVAGLLDELIVAVVRKAGTLEADYTADARFADPAGGVQGDMPCAMLDALTAGVVDATLRPGETVTTLSLTAQFIGGATPGTIQGRAQVGKRGCDICFAHAELHQGGRAVAGAQAVCKIRAAL